MVQWQKQLRQHMVVLLQKVQGNPRYYGATLAAVQFRLWHPARGRTGPRQSRDYYTHGSRLRQSLLMMLVAALLQSSMAIILVTLTLNLLRLSSRTLHLGQFWLEKASFVLVGSLGLWLCWCALKRLHRLLRAAATREQAPVIRALTPVDHHHHANCGCGHCHLLRGEELRAGALLEMVSGIRPFSSGVRGNVGLGKLALHRADVDDFAPASRHHPLFATC